MNDALFRIRNLTTHFTTEDGLVRAVEGVSFAVGKARIFALVGESGCGKSVTALSTMRLIHTPPGAVRADGIVLDGKDLLSLSEREMRAIRGSQISMIFQDPMTSLNPVFTCGYQIMESVLLHRNVNRAAARNLAVEMLAHVGIPEPARRFDEYPHQLSGGMQQRIMIAMALSCRPQLLIADEPTTALDVTIQAQILDLLRVLRDRDGLSILMITHDLGVVAQIADAVGVMYAARMAEISPVNDLFSSPAHPYTQSLFRALPRLGAKRERLEAIAGSVPNPLRFPGGCRFHPRCRLTRELAGQRPSQAVELETSEGKDRVLARCAQENPSLREIAANHWCACWECPSYASAALTDPSERIL